MNFHLKAAQDIVGFSTENALGGSTVKVLSRARLTSDDPEFYLYTEQISSIFLNGIGVFIDSVHRFLVIVHQDLSAEVYVNDFEVAVEIRAKRDIKQGDVVSQTDIADIRKVKFPEIEIAETDRVIYCFKVGWRFGLFFDLVPRVQPIGVQPFIQVEKLDIDKMERSIGDLYRYLSFYHVYKTLESNAKFDEMKKDGWFPFVEILADEYKKLSEAYQNRFDFKNKIDTIIKNFTKDRVGRIVQKWWGNKVFADKKILIEAGINAYLQDTTEGYVNCIKNLWTEIEGILRKLYLTETGKGANVRSNELITFIVSKAKGKSGSDYSLLLPLPFLKYLQDVVFPSFDIETGSVDLSRHTSSHGVAEAQQYTKERALQLILILDQIYFYS